MKLSDFKVISFDVYGTLIDWESGIINALKPMTDCVSANLPRNEILEAHAFYESSQQNWSPGKRYSELLATVYRRLAEEWRVHVTWEECQAYGLSVRQWPAFADSRDALASLKEHFEIVLLSNSDNVSCSGCIGRLGVNFDGVYTAEDIYSYKPNPRNFEYLIQMLERRGIKKREILHTAESLFHDHVPANELGIANCWIHRRHDEVSSGATMSVATTQSYDFKFRSMTEMVQAHKADTRN
jgi:2-haloacid dehalogenase/putative hydrolase of the HAD superfamily